MQNTIDNFPESILLPGEKILWTGSPSALKFASLSLPSGVDIGIAVVLLILGVLVSFRIGNFPTMLPIVAEMFSGLLIVSGCFMLLFPSCFGYFAALGMLYAVTSERLLVVDKRSNKITRQYLPANLDQKPSVTDTGCVYFANSYATPLFGPIIQRVGFDYIQDPRQVAELISATFGTPPES